MDIVVYLDKSVQLSVKKVSLSDVCISHVTRLEILIRRGCWTFFTPISVVIAIIYKDLARSVLMAQWLYYYIILNLPVYAVCIGCFYDFPDGATVDIVFFVSVKENFI